MIYNLEYHDDLLTHTPIKSIFSFLWHLMQYERATHRWARRVCNLNVKIKLRRSEQWEPHYRQLPSCSKWTRMFESVFTTIDRFGERNLPKNIKDILMNHPFLRKGHRCKSCPLILHNLILTIKISNSSCSICVALYAFQFRFLWDAL